MTAAAEAIEDLTVNEIGEALYEIEKNLYHEKPVSIEEFICSSEFLNSEFEGEFYPYWRDELKNVHPTPLYSPYFEILTSQPIGSGKSTSSLVSIAYEIYKMFCLRDPHGYYKIKPRSVKLVFMLFSATIGIAEDVNWTILSSYLDCPWFRKCPQFDSTLNLLSRNNMCHLGQGVWVKVGSRSGQALGQAVFGGLLDEADFQNATSSQNQAHESYLAILRRMESRFLKKGGHIPGKLWLISSPKNETAFLTAHIKEINEKGSSHTYIVPTKPIWKILEGTTKGRDRYDYQHEGQTEENMFSVFLGDDHYDPCIIDENDDPRPLDPSRVIQVPLEHRESFEGSLIEAIRDIVGDAIPEAVNLFPKAALIDMVSTLPTRFNMEFVELDYFDATSRIEDYAHGDYFASPMMPECARFIHVDNAYSKDYLGVSAVFARSEYKTEKALNGELRMIEINRKERFYMQDFCLCIRKKGSSKEIPFYKLKFFFQWLREMGYPIALITFDQFQSKQLMQELEVEGFNVKHLSVDGKHSKSPYQSLSARVAQKKILLARHPRQINELKELREDEDKIDHPLNGSKDLADSLCGAHWNCATAPNIYIASAMVKQSLNAASEDRIPEKMTEKKLKQILSSKPRRI